VLAYELYRAQAIDRVRESLAKRELLTPEAAALFIVEDL
jgi:hypothetical protein